MPDLWWVTATAPLPLPDAVSTVSPVLGSGVTAFLSSPDDHIVAELADGELRTTAGPCVLDGVFAARLFAPQGELRWLHSSDGLGEAVLLAERPGLIPDWADHPAPVVESLDNSYALWGRRLEPSTKPGWVRALEGRIGWIDVPVAGSVVSTPVDQEWPSQYVALQTVEYFDHDEHHNLRLVDERLVRLALIRPGNGRNSRR
jgi:CRISPR-associated protein (TIGR03984 family)